MQRNVLRVIPTKSVIKFPLIKQRFIKPIRVILANLWGKQNISMNWYILFNKCSLNQRYNFNSKSSRLMWHFYDPIPSSVWHYITSSQTMIGTISSDLVSLADIFFPQPIWWQLACVCISGFRTLGHYHQIADSGRQNV